MKKLYLLFLLLATITFVKGQTVLTDSTKKPPPDSIKTTSSNLERANFPFLQTLPPSPEAASIGQYGSLPVALHSGTTSLQVPFCTLESGGLQVSVGLSHHSAAMKVSDIASSVGTGWSLQAGGVITRVLRGNKADEDGANGYLDNVIPPSSDLEAYGCYRGQIEDGTVDGLADDFYYNFNGRSGRFKYSNYTDSGVLQTTETPVLMPDAAIKIEWLSTRRRFKLTDENGTVYIFGLSLSGDIAYEETTSSNNVETGSSTHLSAWYLTEMVSADRVDTVWFKYSNPVITVQPSMNSTTLVRTKLSGSPLPTYEYIVGQRTQSIKTVHLTSIETKNGKVELEYTTDREDTRDATNRLRRMVLYDASGKSLKRLELSQSYFACDDGRSQVDVYGSSVIHPPTSYLRKRLRLDSAEYQGGSGAAISAYSFTYNEAEPLPIYGALAQDFWGYYNGATLNKHLILKDIGSASDLVPTLQNGADRSPDFDKALLGSLSRVIYPTGGHTDFIYEENLHPVDSVAGGGIRIKQLVDSTEAGSTRTGISRSRMFNYTACYYTSNLFTGNYETLSAESVRTFESQDTCPTTGDNTQTSYAETLTYSIGTNSGSGIAYNEIEEVPFNIADSTTTGKTVYEYPVVQDFTVPIYQYVQYLREWQRGFLEKKTVYKGSPGSFTPVTEEINTYTKTFLPDVSIGTVVRKTYDQISTSPVCGLDRIITAYCNLYDRQDTYESFETTETSQRIQLTRTEQKTFDESGNNPVVVVQEIEYANAEHLLPTKSTTYRSNGEALEKRMKYPHEVSSGGNVYSGMVARHIYSPVIEEEIYEDANLLKSRRTNYQHWYPTATYGDVLGFYAPISVEEQFAGGSWRTLVTMGEKLNSPTQPGFDTRNRPVLYTDRSGLTTTVDYYETAGKRDLLKSTTAGGLTTSFDYEPLRGLNQQTAPNGLITSYEYDDFGRLRTVKDNQGDLTDLYQYKYAGKTLNNSGQLNISVDKNAVLHSQFKLVTTDTSTYSSPGFAITQVSYLDGLGRPEQELGFQHGQGGTGQDIIYNSTYYDDFGRPVRSVLPTAALLGTPGRDGSFKPAADTAAILFYQDMAPFDETTEFDGSPLNRPKISYGAGQLWRDSLRHTQQFYETGGAEIRRYVRAANGDITIAGNFPANSLFKNITVDEQRDTTISFTDKQGRLVQQWVQDENGYIITSYVYDGLDRLVAVIQPQGYANGGNFTYDQQAYKNYIFAYEYDANGRVSRKHIPGGGWTNYIFDLADRVVLEQSALQDSLNRWSFIKYDELGRMALTGELESNRNQTTLQSDFDGIVTPFETRSVNSYDDVSFPSNVVTGDYTERQFFYYDNHDWIATEWAFDPNETPLSEGNAYYQDSRGLLTGYKSNSTLQSDTLYHCVRHYDNKGFLKYEVKTHHKSGASLVTSPLQLKKRTDFLGNVVTAVDDYNIPSGFTNNIIFTTYNAINSPSRIRSVQNGLGSGGFLDDTELYYDGLARLSRSVVNLNDPYGFADLPDFISLPPNPVSSRSDAAKKSVTLNPGTLLDPQNTGAYVAFIDPDTLRNAVGLQVMDYRYHLRGGLLGVNLNINGDPVPKIIEGDLYAYRLDYEKAGRWDGNIGQQRWQSADTSGTQSGFRTYKYSYDTAKRLKKATYSGVGAEDYSLPNINYDKNGNITFLARNGKTATNFGATDRLFYSYAGNQLTTVSDFITTDNKVDFVPRGNGTYTYYPDGSLKSDANEGISLIVYDTFLKQPQEIQLNDGRKIKHYYNGAGALLRTEYLSTTGNVQEVWDYLEELAMRNDTVYQVSVPQGRLLLEQPLAGSADPARWVHEHFYQDHLGNTRVSFKDSSGHLVKTAETAFDPWGVRLNGVGSANEFQNRWELQGKERDLTFGLNRVNFGARIYNPTIGRWDRVDNFSELMPSFSGYRYAFNNPLNYIDPDGNFETEAEAKHYAEQQKIKLKGGFFRIFQGGRSSIEKQDDGSYAIENRREGTAISDDEDFGITKAVVVRANDAMSFNYSDENSSTGMSITRRDGLVEELKPVTGNAPDVGPGKGLKLVKPSISAIKKALKEVYKKLDIDGPLPKMPKGTGPKSTPRAGNAKKGYRLDPPHDHKPFWHIDWWMGKRKAGKTGFEKIK